MKNVKDLILPNLNSKWCSWTTLRGWLYGNKMDWNIIAANTTPLNLPTHSNIPPYTHHNVILKHILLPFFRPLQQDGWKDMSPLKSFTCIGKIPLMVIAMARRNFATKLWNLSIKTPNGFMANSKSTNIMALIPIGINCLWFMINSRALNMAMMTKLAGWRWDFFFF